MRESNEKKVPRLHRKFLKEYQQKRQHVVNGYVNCIPFPFERFRKELPGIERKKNYIITANSKVGKTQIADYLFVLSVIDYAYKNRDKVRVKILYFSLEMSIQEKMSQWTCFWLYMHTKGRIRIDTKTLNSLNEKNPVSEEILELLESREYQNYFDFLEDTIIFNETDRNPYGIYKNCVDFALANGKIVYKTIQQKEKQSKYNDETGKIEDVWVNVPKQIVDYYEPNDPELYIIKVVDHVALYTPERGMNLRETMGKASSQDNVILRNIYGFTNVDIQQQAADKEGMEAFKLDRMTPTPDGLGENKTTQRDCNVMLGLFSPFRFDKPTWKGYDVNEFKDNIRFLEVCLNRNGSSGAICPLFFDGAVNFFAELPLPNNKEGLDYYRNLARIAQSN